MKKRKASRKKQKRLVIPGWLFVVAAIIVISLLGSYIVKNDTFGTEASTITNNMLESVEVSPINVQLSEGQSTWFNAIAKGVSASSVVTYKWVNDDTGSSAGVKTTLSSNSSNQIRLTVVTAPDKGGWSLLTVTASSGNISKTYGTVIGITPARQISSVQISPAANYTKIDLRKSLHISANAYDTNKNVLNNGVNYKWRIHNITASGYTTVDPNKESSIKVTSTSTGPYGGYFIVFVDAIHKGVTKTTGIYVVVNPQSTTLSSVVVAPKMGTYFSGKLYEFTAKALDASNSQIKEGVSFSWVIPSAPKWLLEWSIVEQVVLQDGTGLAKIKFALPPNSPVWSGVIYAKAIDANGVTKQDHAIVNLVKSS